MKNIKLVCSSLILISLFSCNCRPQKPSNVAANNSEKIDWQPCESNHKQIIDLTPYECGTLKVPLNWEDVHGKKIALSLKRVKAKQVKERIGSLFYINGGPGAPSIDSLNSIAHFGDKELSNKFDLISYDPRGIGKSTPLSCEKGFENITPVLPATEEQFLQLQNNMSQLRQSCLDKSGELLNYVGTENVVKDLDAIRKALREEKLNLYGVSYGTSVVATYAYRYPNNSRALVLDGVVDRSLPLQEIIKNDVQALKLVYDKFVNYCVTDSACGFTAEDINKIFSNLKNEYHYLVDGKNKVITKNEILYLFSYFIHERNWKNLAVVLNEIKKPYFEFSNCELLKNHYEMLKSMAIPYFAVSCADYPQYQVSWHEYLQLQQEANKILPVFNGQVNTLFTIGVCSGWKNSVVKPLVTEYKVTIPQKALIVSSHYDSNTPHVNAILKQKQIAGSQLLESDIIEHGLFLSSTDRTCINNGVIQFLLTANYSKTELNCIGK